MSDTKITTLSAFLQHSGANYRVFDMGRRVAKLNPMQFVDFENAQQPYPYPMQKTALFGVIFWNPALPEKHYVWFLKFPLDEQGLLLQAARDEFLVMLLDRVGECMLAASDGNAIEGALKDSPYTFMPRDDKMAAFNAKASQSLARPPSRYYQDALAYFTGQQDNQAWQSLALQGVADVAIRLDEHGQTRAMLKRLPELPETPFSILSSFLEHAAPSTDIVEAFASSVEVELQQPQPNITKLCACLRAVSNSPAQGLVEQLLMDILNNECSRHIELLATIAGRLWALLEQDAICTLFVERLAGNDAGASGFNQVLADVIYMPGLRSHIMAALRAPTRSATLTKRVGEMFGQAIT